MGYLSDYLSYTSGNECPRSFWIWSALGLLGHLAGRKIHYPHGGDWLKINPAIYVGLIGTAGSGKSTAKGEVKGILIEHFPQYLFSASIQSREDIIVKMAGDACLKTYDAGVVDGIPIIGEYRPFYIIANEFENFLSVDPIRMTAFLVDVFDENYFSTGFKKDVEQQNFKNPSVSILACGTPSWLMREMKMQLFTGGLGRRLILVCDEKGEPCPDPYRPSDYAITKARVIDHLKWVEQQVGVFTRSDCGKKWWWDWYTPHMKAKVDDPLLSQFKETKHIMLIKLAMILALTERTEKLIITGDHFAMALKLFDDLIPRVQQLTAGVGKNETAGYAVQMTEFVRMAGGYITEKHFYGSLYRNSPGGQRAYDEAVKFLIETGALLRAGKPFTNSAGEIIMQDGKPKMRSFFFTPESWKSYQSAQGLDSPP